MLPATHRAPSIGGSLNEPTVDWAMRLVGAALIVLAFSFPAMSVVFPGIGAAGVAVPETLTPLGVYLMWRLYPEISVPGAVTRLLLPVGTLWLTAGATTFAVGTDLVADPHLMTAGAVLIAAGLAAVSMNGASRHGSSLPSRS